MNYRRVILIAILGLVGLTTRSLPAAPATKPDPARDALRLLRAECFACHNEEKKKGGLALTSREAMLKGGDEGKVVVPGKPEASLLAKALIAGTDPHMPPKKQLTDAQIKVVRDWIKSGAVWSEAALADEEPVAPVKIGTLPADYQPVTALALSPDGNGLAFGRGASLLLHDLSLTNFPLVAQQAWKGDAVQSVAWRPDGHQIAVGAFRRLALLDGGSLRLEREWTNGLAGRITALKFSPDGARLALADSVAGSGGFVRVLELTNARAFTSWRAHSDTVFSLDFSRDGTQLATAGGDKLVKIWSIASRQELARLEGHTAQVLAVAFNTNATQVVSGGADKQLKVWDIKTREKISTLGNHATAVTAVAWPGDGQTIVAANEGGSVFTYKNLKSHTGEQSSASGDERLAGKAEDTLECLATSAGAKLFYAGSQSGVVYLWDGDRKLLGRLAPASVHSLVPKSPAVATNPTPLARSKAPVARTNAPVSVRPELIVGLTAEPNRIQLAPEAPFHSVVITAQTADGFAVDVTGQARFSAKGEAPFRIDSAGGVQAIRAGEGVLMASVGRQRVEIPVKVTGSDLTNETALPVVPTSFVRDVLPALSKAGCNAGPCHAKPEGQNGFKLSVFSYDPKADYSAIVKENRGRRVFPAAPEQSLILQKPSTALPHEGGLRIERGSETWQLLTRWLAAGMPFQQTNEAALQHISVFPKERRYHKGSRQQLLVRAHYADGSARDVSRLAAFDSNDKEIAKVDATGEITIGTLTGQGVVVARYMGFVADAQIMVPADRLLPEAQYAALPRNNFIDDQAYARLQRLGLFPSELCTDAEFLRRAKLDAIGLLPTPAEVKAFLADPAPGKRQRFIAHVLDDPAYADYWANKWADLLRPNPDRVGVKSVFTLDQWLRDRFGKNEPYDQFVREILLAEGTNHRDGPAVIYRDRREPPELTTMFSQLFLGTRLECAKCHHHPNEKWAQEDFYQFAAFFGPVKQKGAGLSPPISAGTETFYFGKGGAVKHPVTGTVMTPRPLDGPLITAQDVDPRRALADWLTSPENPYFARAAVNRVWATFFGRGLVEPVDDFRISNPCVNPELLTSLAEDFTKHSYDLKHLMRRIMESRLYQLSSTPNDTNVGDTRNFSRAYRRRLPAEVLLDAVNDATGVPDTFAAMPVGGRATQAWSYKIDSNFMDAFGRPNASSDCPCERDTQLSVVQSLHLMNSKSLQGKLANTTGRARQLADGKLSPAEVVTELYLTTLNRPPTESELKVTTAVFNAPEANRRAATEDVFWALLNSPEFVFNH